MRVQVSERRKRFGLLLVSISSVFAVEGIANPGRGQQIVVSILLAVTLFASLRVAEARPTIFAPALMVTLALALLGIVAAISGHVPSDSVAGSNLLLVTMAPPAIVVGTVRTLRLRRQVTVEAVFGVLCLYLLLGMFFAFSYVLIGRLNGGSFFAQSIAPTTARCLYFSFTTLTTVGYGDLTAASNLGHTLSMSEALVGQIYLVTVVSLIVGNLGLRRDGLRARRLGDNVTPLGENVTDAQP
jgi:hypothetical protein